MNIYNVALGVAGTWHEVTIPRGISNIRVTSRGGNDLRMRRAGQTDFVTIDISVGPLEILDRRWKEEGIYEIACPGAANEIAEVTVW